MAVSSDIFLLERPFGEATNHILRGWWRSAALFAATPPALWASEEFAAAVSGQFINLGSLPTQNDPHLSEGIFELLRTLAVDEKPSRRKTARTPMLTRPYALLLRHFTHNLVRASVDLPPHKQMDRHNRPKQYLFSPLFFLRQMLTAPEYIATEAYGHAIVRAEIFLIATQISTNRLGAEPNRPFNAIERVRSLIEFEQVAASLQKAKSYRRRGDTFYPADPTDFIIGHLLASRGLAVLTFAPGGNSYESARTNELPMIGRDNFLNTESMIVSSHTYEFRILDDVKRVPSPAELTNELDGLPLPIPGANTVFARGLRSTTSRGVVGRVSGASGSGKTTLALALAASLAPLGVVTHYVSCEESPADLAKRIFTLTPSFVGRTLSFPKELDDWFVANHLDETPLGNRREAFSIVSGLISTYENAKISIPNDCPPGITPLLVVFDGIHELLDRNPSSAQANASSLAELLHFFRKLGAVVLLLTAETAEPILRDLDYAVDFVIRVEHTTSDSSTTIPDRRLVLHKTRLQYSRHGSHLLHISRNQGVKIYPHLAAQLDVFSPFKWKQVDKSSWFDFLQKADVEDRSLAKIFRILAGFDHGQGKWRQVGIRA